MQLTVNGELITVVPQRAIVTNNRKSGEATIKISVKTGVMSLSSYQQECIERVVIKALKHDEPAHEAKGDEKE